MTDLPRTSHLLAPGALLLAALALNLWNGSPFFGFNPPSVRADETSSTRFESTGVQFLKRYCNDCHSGDLPSAGLSLAEVGTEADVVQRWKAFEGVLSMVSLGAMPPADADQPPAAERAAFVRSLKAVFEQAARNAPRNPGRVTMRRLNRTEYRNTIRDLIGVTFDPTEDFPSDDIGHGFDNIGDVLTISPVLMERYLAAAENIMQAAIVPNPPAPPKRHLNSRYTEPAGANVPLEGRFRVVSSGEGSPVETGPVHTQYKWVEDGEYIFRSRVYAVSEGDQPVRAAVFVVGDLSETSPDEELDRIAGAGMKSLRQAKILQVIDITADSPEKPQMLEVNVPAIPGRKRMALGLIRPAEDAGDVRLYVEYLALEGPLDTRPASHRRLLARDESLPQDQQTLQVLERFASRAYRRPAAAEEVARLAQFVDAVLADGGSWEQGIQLAMQAVLCSPKFLFRVELDADAESDTIRPLDEFQLASRLSYFLWSSMPDDELLELARNGKLTENLDAQVRRMLDDPRAMSLVDSFALQWLQLKRLETFEPDRERFPKFTAKLRSAMLEETRLTLESVIREDRSLLELIDADYTYLNETLARHYGIVDTAGNRAGQKPAVPGGKPIKGDAFVRVQLQDRERGGLLTQAAVLTVTSNPTRTSPVKRGRWILEQILGTPPPPPPPDVPLLDESEAALTGSLRERMEQHRKNPGCASCHVQMDAMGFAFENFDAIGGFRLKDGEFDIDPSGELPDGGKISGPADLKTILIKQSDQFARSLAEKMLTYALGRGLEYYDTRAVDKIVAALKANDYRFSTLVLEIVHSDPFRNRRG